MKAKIAIMAVISIFAIVGCAQPVEKTSSPSEDNNILFAAAQKAAESERYEDLSQGCKLEVTNTSVGLVTLMDGFLLTPDAVATQDKKVEIQKLWLDFMGSQSEVTLKTPKNCNSPIDAGLLSVDMLDAMLSVIDKPELENALEGFIYLVCEQSSALLRQNTLDDTVSEMKSCISASKIYDQEGSEMKAFAAEMFG